MFTSEAPAIPTVPTVPIVPTTPQIDRFGTKLLSSSDVSQLAKSGDIDITEAIAARRT